MTLDPATLAALFAPASPTVGAIAGALSKAQASIEHAVKTGTNPQTKSRYADLTGILDVTREPFQQNGLSVVQSPFHLPGDPPSVVLVTTLMHESGEWVRSVTPVNPRVKVSGGGGAVMAVDDMQTIGSAITYARRYALAAMAGIGQEDDDGNTASGRGMKAQATQEAARPAGRTPVAQAPTEEPEDAPTLADLSALCKVQDIAPKYRMPFFRFVTKRQLRTANDLASADIARMVGWSSQQWRAAIEDFAEATAQPPEPDEGEPDWSDIAPVEDGSPIGFDPNGKADRKPRKAAGA